MPLSHDLSDNSHSMLIIQIRTYEYAFHRNRLPWQRDTSLLCLSWPWPARAGIPGASPDARCSRSGADEPPSHSLRPRSALPLANNTPGTASASRPAPTAHPCAACSRRWRAASPAGLWLTSTAGTSNSVPFRVAARSVGREHERADAAGRRGRSPDRYPDGAFPPAQSGRGILGERGWGAAGFYGDEPPCGHGSVAADFGGGPRARGGRPTARGSFWMASVANLLTIV